MSKFAVTTTASFDKKIKKLDRQVAKRILERLYGLAFLEHPQERCKPLTGPLVGLWRLRAGNYRVMLDIRTDVLVIVALDVDHRSRIYEHPVP